MNIDKGDEAWFGLLMVSRAWRNFDSPLRRVVLRMVCDEAVDMLWRIEKKPDEVYELMYLGHLPIDGPRVLQYSDYSKLPEWVKDRIAVLSMLKPHVYESMVYGVGRRVDTDTYWVVEPRGTNGSHT